jgi:hypothetical protein
MSLRATRAIARSEGAALYASWLLRGWVVLVAVMALLALASIDEARSVSRGLAGYLAVYSLPSAILAGVLGAAAMSSDLDVAADSVLARAVTRTDFTLGKVGSRLLLVLAAHLLVVLPTMYLAQKIGSGNADDVQIFVVAMAMGLTLVFLVALGSFVGALFRNTLMAVALLMIAFASQSLIFDFAGLEYLSPTALLRDVEDWLDGRAGTWEQARYMLAFAAATVACFAATLATFYRRDL